MRKPVDGMATGIMVLLCLVWGAQQVEMKAIAEDVSLMVQVSLRSGVAALLVWIAGRWIFREDWLPTHSSHLNRIDRQKCPPTILKS